MSCKMIPFGRTRTGRSSRDCGTRPWVAGVCGMGLVVGSVGCAVTGTLSVPATNSLASIVPESISTSYSLPSEPSSTMLLSAERFDLSPSSSPSSSSSDDSDKPSAMAMSISDSAVNPTSSPWFSGPNDSLEAVFTMVGLIAGALA